MFDWRAPVLLPLLLLVASRAAMFRLIPNANEDAYITFRYAWNWAHGLGPVFNAGEGVMGYTSPPWMAWIALGLALHADPVWWTRGTLLVADAVTLLAMVSLLERHASRAAAWCFAFFFAAWVYYAGLFCSGLESGAMVALIAGTAWLADRRSRATGPALGLLAVFRPEGLLAAAALGVWTTWRDRFVALAILLVTLALLTFEYGSPVPQSVIAKAVVYGAHGPLAGPQWWEWMVPLPAAVSTSESKNLSMLIVLLSPAAVAGVLALWKVRRSALAGVFAGLAVVWAALFATGASYFFWYFAAPLTCWAGFASVGLPTLVRRPHVYVAAACMVAGLWFNGKKIYVGRAETESNLFGTVADYVGTHANPGDTVLLEPIGFLGWRCREQRLADEVGLVSPRVLAQRRLGAGWYSRSIDELEPRWLVVRAGVLSSRQAYAGLAAPFADIAEERRIMTRYKLVAATDTTLHDETLCVLERMVPAR